MPNWKGNLGTLTRKKTLRFGLFVAYLLGSALIKQLAFFIISF